MLNLLVWLGLVAQGHKAALVVGASSLVIERHEAIALEVSNGNERLVNGELLVVGTNTVAVGIRVREETRLQYGIG